MGENKKKKKKLFTLGRLSKFAGVRQSNCKYKQTKNQQIFFFFLRILIEWQLNSFHNCLIRERESHRVEESLNYYQIRFDGIINRKLKSQKTLIKRWSENVNLQKEGKEKEKKKVEGPMTQPLLWLNKSVATINATVQLLDIYIYIQIYMHLTTLFHSSTM